MHSPSVGPAIWQGVADRLRDKGIDVRVPSFIGVGEGPAPYWPQVIQRAVHSVGNDARPVVIVPHSNAGLFVPLVVDRLGERAAACVLVDASLPPAEGESAVVPADFLPFLRAKAVDGILPRWSDWWEEEEIASLYPDQETRSALTAEEPQLPLVYYEQTIPVPGGWDRRPCAYLWFGPPYDETAKRAGDRGWIVEHLGGAHLHMVIDPAAVADRIQALTETVLGDREDAWLALKPTRPTDQRSGAADPERRVYTAPTMQVAGTGFSFEMVDADDYDALRPDYALEAVGWVGERGGLGEGSLVVDLAAGTGQLSRRFVPLGVKMVAVEPARNMRLLIENRLPAVDVLDGSAEAIPLDDAVAHAVVVGNAFHHFDAERAFAEIRRVLRPGGALALFWAWSADDQASPYPALREVDQAVEPVRAATGIAAVYRRWTDPPKQVHGFTPFERREFPTTHVVPSARLADLYATSSDVASLPPDVRADVLARIREVSQSLPGVLEFPARSVVDLCFTDVTAR